MWCCEHCDEDDEDNDDDNTPYVCSSSHHDSSCAECGGECLCSRHIHYWNNCNEKGCRDCIKECGNCEYIICSECARCSDDSICNICWDEEKQQEKELQQQG